MSTRQLFEVALRVLGVWYCLTAVTGVALTISFALATTSLTMPNRDAYLVAYVATLASQVAIGAALILWAPAIVSYFLPEEEPRDAPQTRVGPGDIYHV